MDKKTFSISIDELNQGIREFNEMNDIKKSEDKPLDYKSFMAGWICAHTKEKR
jgi:hypothetical protein